MKTFEDEYLELLGWYKEQSEELFKLPREPVELCGLDGGEYEKQRRIVDREYYQRLRSLEEKYNRVSETA